MRTVAEREVTTVKKLSVPVVSCDRCDLSVVGTEDTPHLEPNIGGWIEILVIQNDAADGAYSILPEHRLHLCPACGGQVIKSIRARKAANDA